jgi:hypothetical protein
VGVLDAEHRYCPQCGQMLVMRDPPENVETSAWLAIGRQAIGPETGNLYRYADSAALPRRVDPLSEAGPFGELGLDLWPSSHAPPTAPWATWARAAETSDFPSSGGSMTRGLSDLAARHGLLYAVVADTRHVEAWDPTECRRVQHWSLAEADMEDLLPEAGLRVSETLVYGVCRTSGAVAALRALHAGTGRPVLDLPLPIADARPLIVGDRAWVIGPSGHNTCVAVAFEIAGTRATEVAQTEVNCSLPSNAAGSPPSLLFLKGHVVIAAPDGRLWRWSGEAGSPAGPLYGPPRDYVLQDEAYALEGGEVGFVALGPKVSAPPTVIRVGAREPDGVPELRGAVSLPPMPILPSGPCLAVREGYLYVCVCQPGEPIVIVKRRTDSEGGVWDRLVTIPGTQRVRDFRMYAIPADGGLTLCLQVVQDNSRSCYLVNPRTGVTDAVDLHPHCEEDVRIVWTAGHAWRANLTTGRLQQIM